MKVNFLIRIINRVVRLLLKGYQVCPTDFSPNWRKINIYKDAGFSAYSSLSQVIDNTLLKADRLSMIYGAVLWISINKKSPFRSMEVGVYRGGGSYFIANCLKHKCDNYLGHYAVDSFEGHQLEDIPQAIEGAHVPYMFSDTSSKGVSDLLSSLGCVETIVGRVQDIGIDYHEIGFVHLDTDLYAPTKWVLERMRDEARAPWAMLIDDYGFDTCPGVRAAVDEFLPSISTTAFYCWLSTGQYMIVRT